MQPIKFPEANTTFGPPDGMSVNQVAKVVAHCSHVASGTCKGRKMVITAWRPNAQEIEAIRKGQPIFVTFLGGLPPHFVTVTFGQASHPA